MYFISTRGKKEKIKGSQTIINGICSDGGLYVPESFPDVSDKLDNLVNLSYKDLCFEILKLYLDDFTEEELKNCINKAYDDKFDCKEIAPTVKVKDKYFLELYHGPTCAFKDMALTLMPLLLETSLKKNNIKEDILILTATSGDTGKAALEGFKNLNQIKIIVFFPEDGVSSIQKLQMQSQEGDNTYVVSINGNFDDAQSAVKTIFNDEEFKEILKNNNYILSSANSINISRLLPQIVYYFYSYFDLVKNKVNNILEEYADKASEIAKLPISIHETNNLMDLEEEMCLKILNAWEINKFKTDAEYILKGSILLNKDKFIYKTLIGKIMRLIPGGVTILSIGINSSLARRFTLALGYSMSQLSTTYINLVIENKDIDPLNIFTKEAIEDLMESYLIEYNKTVTN